MPALDRNEKITCDKCGTQTTKKNIVRHKTRCSAGTLYCTQCPNFSTKSGDDLNYHIAKRHATPRAKNAHKCKICFKEFSGFYALRQHKTNEHGLQMKSAEFDVSNLLEDDDADLKENSKPVNTSSLTLSLKKEDIVFSISPCQPSTTL